jgi:hypothetical protein
MSYWQPVSLGEDVPDVPARLACGLGQDNVLTAHLKFRARDGKVYLVRACLDVSRVEEEVGKQFAAELLANRPTEISGDEVEVGRWLRKKLKKLGGKIKKVAKKIAHSKVVKAVVKTAKKAINNPFVKAALQAAASVVPGGAAAVLAANAARIAAKAIKGAKGAKQLVQTVRRGVMAGDDSSVQAARLIREGMRRHGMLSPVRAVMGADGRRDERAFLYAVLGECVGPSSYAVSAGADGYLITAGCANDISAGEVAELEAFEDFATSGAWEGTRWLLNRLAPRSMASHPDEMTARSLLMLGHAAQAARA